jgi:hypothetical protein
LDVNSTAGAYGRSLANRYILIGLVLALKVRGEAE